MTPTVYPIPSGSKYHVVWIPKYRRKKLFEELRKELGPVLRELAQHKESEILEGRMLLDPVHMLIAIPPKYAVSQVVGYMKGKSAIHIARAYLGRERNFAGQHFWAGGYYVSTVGLDETGRSPRWNRKWRKRTRPWRHSQSKSRK
jgi:putative transposase